LVLLVLSGADNFHEILEKGFTIFCFRFISFFPTHPLHAQTVETSTLLFFAGLFVLVRCVEELGVTVWIANSTSDIIDLVPQVPLPSPSFF
jgi:di/tricarboxylate transporter